VTLGEDRNPDGELLGDSPAIGLAQPKGAAWIDGAAVAAVTEFAEPR